jgi:hypothetical protein
VESTKEEEAGAELPLFWAAGAAAASVMRALDGAAFDVPEDHSPAIEACRELRAAGLVRGCAQDTATKYSVGEIVRFVNARGALEGLIVRINGAERIEAVAAAKFPETTTTRPCALITSPGSRLIALLGESMSCDAAPIVRAALDRQSHVTMLMCLEIVDEGLLGRPPYAPSCEWWRGNSLGGVDGEVTPFVNGALDDLGGGILLPKGGDNFAQSLKTVRDSHPEDSCRVVGSTGSGVIAVLPPGTSCDVSPHVMAVLDSYASRVGQAAQVKDAGPHGD